MIHILVICNNPHTHFVNKLEKIVRSVTKNQTDTIHMHFIVSKINIIRTEGVRDSEQNVLITVSEFLIGEDDALTRAFVKSEGCKYDFVFYNQCPIPSKRGAFFGPVKSAEAMRSYLPKLLKPRGYVVFAALRDKSRDEDMDFSKDVKADMFRRNNKTHIYETLESMGMKNAELPGYELLTYRRHVKMDRSRTARRASRSRSRSIKSAPSMFLPYSV